MVQIAPTDPYLRKIVLPSIIRISDAWTKRRLSYPVSRNRSSRFSKPSHYFHAPIVQLKLEL